MYDPPEEEKDGKPSSPWSSSGRSGGGPAWGKRQSGGKPSASKPSGSRSASRASAPKATSGGSSRENTQTQRDRWMDQDTRRQVGEALRQYNLGAKLAKVADDVHQQLKFYFPPANGRNSITYQRNGVSYEKVFDTEQKTYRDTLKKFEAAVDKVDGIEGSEAEELRSRATQNLSIIKGILDEMRQHKLRLLAGLSKAEELRVWQGFVTARRSSLLTQAIEPK